MAYTSQSSHSRYQGIWCQTFYIRSSTKASIPGTPTSEAKMSLVIDRRNSSQLGGPSRLFGCVRAQVCFWTPPGPYQFSIVSSVWQSSGIVKRLMVSFEVAVEQGTPPYKLAWDPLFVVLCENWKMFIKWVRLGHNRWILILEHLEESWGIVRVEINQSKGEKYRILQANSKIYGKKTTMRGSKQCSFDVIIKQDTSASPTLHPFLRTASQIPLIRHSWPRRFFSVSPHAYSPTGHPWWHSSF